MNSNSDLYHADEVLQPALARATGRVGRLRFENSSPMSRTHQAGRTSG
jgi:hypothetical protein